MRLVGLTGGIGSGKSTVATMLQKLGATVVAADAISRSTTAAGGSAMAAIRTAFGDDFVDEMGALNRSKMRDYVFRDVRAKSTLEAITHPLIKAEMERQIAKAQTSVVVLDLPLLAEGSAFSGWKSLLDKICVIDCAPSTQISRVMARNQMTQAQVQAIINQQATRQERWAMADIVIANDGLSLSVLEQYVAEAFAKL